MLPLLHLQSRASCGGAYTQRHRHCSRAAAAWMGDRVELMQRQLGRLTHAGVRAKRCEGSKESERACHRVHMGRPRQAGVKGANERSVHLRQRAGRRERLDGPVLKRRQQRERQELRAVQEQSRRGAHRRTDQWGGRRRRDGVRPFAAAMLPTCSLAAAPAAPAPDSIDAPRCQHARGAVVAEVDEGRVHKPLSKQRCDARAQRVQHGLAERVGSAAEPRRAQMSGAAAPCPRQSVPNHGGHPDGVRQHEPTPRKQHRVQQLEGYFVHGGQDGHQGGVGDCIDSRRPQRRQAVRGQDVRGELHQEPDGDGKKDGDGACRTDSRA